MTREEGVALAQQLGSLFLECSAKTRENVEQCFEELALKVIMFSPPLSVAVIYMCKVFLTFEASLGLQCVSQNFGIISLCLLL